MPLLECAECPGCEHREPTPAPQTYPAGWFVVLGGDCEREGYCSRGCAARHMLNGQVIEAKPFGISEQEATLIGQLGLGRSNKEIARHVGWSETTVKNHLSLVFAKLGVSDRVQCVLMAHAVGLIDLPSLSRQVYAEAQERARQRIGRRLRHGAPGRMA